MGHARALLALPTAAKQSAACRKIIEEGLSVRQSEKLSAPAKPKAKPAPKAKDPIVARLEDDLRRHGTLAEGRSLGRCWQDTDI